MIDQSGRELALRKGLFKSHSVVFGSIAGAFFSLIIGVSGAPLILLLLAPFAAGLLSGSIGNGAKAGILSVIFAILLLVPTSLMLPVQNANLPSDVSGAGIVGGTLAALTNGLLGSARVTMRKQMTLCDFLRSSTCGIGSWTSSQAGNFNVSL